MHTIELDCPPGNPRPGDLIGSVLEGTGVVVGEPVGKLFGNWTWEIPTEQAECYKAAQPFIAARIKALYRAGVIRYGSW